MAWEIERLVSHLLMVIACAGERGEYTLNARPCKTVTRRLMLDGSKETKNVLIFATLGCSIHDLVDEIRGLEAGHTRDIGEALSGRAVATIWRWIVSRNDISVGVDKEHNNLSLEDALTLSAKLSRPSQNASIPPQAADHQPRQHDNVATAPSGSDSRTPDRSKGIKVFASEDTMWEAITGHSQNYKRVPRSEWLLLMGIASTKAEGILQGDLGRLVDQDKRSVPKRTDALVKKGYIVKRTTLVRGTKTSKLWLKVFTPSLPKESDEAESASDIEMNLSHHVLTASLEPVPWHGRWTTESIDYTALATTIMAIAKEWKVIRIQDLKAKLGVLGMRWQMKTVSKICRFLNSCQAIQYVAAKLEDKLFKDCIQFAKDLTSKDWANFLATGKRGKVHSTPRIPGGIHGADADLPNDYSEMGAARLETLEPWTVDSPLPHFIAKSAQRFALDGLTNPDLYALALGPSYNRYISSMTAFMAASRTQPTYLKHFQLKSVHIRSGKVASYRYSTVLPSPGAPSAQLTSSPGRESENETLERQGSPGLNLLGFHSNTATPRYKGETTSLSEICGLSSLRDDGQRAGARKRGRPKKVETRQEEQSIAVAPATETQTSLAMESEPNTSAIGAHHTAERAAQLLDTSANGQPAPLPIKRDSVDVNVSPSAQTPQETDAPMRSTSRISNAGSRVRGKRDASSRGRGRGRGRPPLALSDGSSTGKPWVCEKCGGAWKNDIGLKYHLEKSKTACNPHFVAEDHSTSRGAQKPKFYNPGGDIVTLQNHDPTEQETSGDALEAHRQTDVILIRPEAKEHHNESPKIRKKQKLSSLKSWKRSIAVQFSHSPTVSQPSDISTGQGLLLARSPRQPHEKGASSALRSFSASVTKRPVKTTQAALIDVNVQACSGRRVMADAEPQLAENCRQDQHAQLERNTVVVDSNDENVSVEHQRDMLRDIIISVITNKNGAALRGDALCDSIWDSWCRLHTALAAPKSAQCEAAIDSLVKDGALSEHHHALRASTGSFTKCHVLTLPGIDALSAEAMKLVQGYKESLQGVEVSTKEPLSRENGSKSPLWTPPGRRRRLLANEIAVLHAPVYAAQVAAKHNSGSAVNSRRTVKRRPRAIEAAGGLGRRRGLELPSNSRDRSIFESDNVADSSTLADEAKNFVFLEPNTYLEREPPQNSAVAHSISIDPVQRTSNSEAILDTTDHSSTSIPEGVCFRAVETVSGQTGVWPKLDAQHFELRDCSATMAGWFPSSQWFRWSDFGTLVQRRHKLLEGKLRSQQGNSLSARQRFLASLQAFAQLEDEWALSFINGLNCSAGPHNIFLRLSGPSAETNVTTYTALSWPADGYLTQDSGDFARGGEHAESSSDEELFPPHFTLALETRRPTLNFPSKVVAFASRTLTSLPNTPSSATKSKNSSSELLSEEELTAAFVALRVLMGGVDRAIDWGLLSEIFPSMTILQLRKFWIDAREQQGPYISTFTKAFQDAFITACESKEIAMVNFEQPLEYDWAGLIRWTMQIPRKEGFQLPCSRAELDHQFTLTTPREPPVDWRETFFHGQSSIFARFEAVTAKSGAYVITNATADHTSAPRASDHDIAKSWIKALCSMGDGRYSVEEIRDRLLALSGGSKQQTSQLLKKAIDQLTRERVICKSKKPPFGGRPYRLNESYLNSLAKVCQRGKYMEAAAFKVKLDNCFRRRQQWEISYAITDGEVMALMNLNAAGRIRLLPRDLPDMPFGFEPGNYESRKYPKSYYHFPVVAVPTEEYQYNEQVRLLRLAKETLPPLAGPLGEIPQWVDIFGEYNLERWAEILGAACFVYATRGSLDALGLCSALSPILDHFEARLILEWGRETGVLSSVAGDLGVNVCEWWWLVVPHL